MEWFYSAIQIIIFITISSGLQESSKTENFDDDIEIKKFPFLMPKVHPNRPELYLCTPVRVDYTKTYYIVGYEPNATMNTAHHMLLYGCEEPGSDKPIWDCGEMAKSVASDMEKVSPCAPTTHSQILYAWAKNAPKLELPKDVGFKVGKNSSIKYMVLQVHYAHVKRFMDGSKDDSGVFINYTTKPLNKLAGVILLGTAGSIEPKKIEHMETACRIKENKIIHPFAYRIHTHHLGVAVSGYRVRTDDSGIDHWKLLGIENPQLPQMFYPVKNTEPIIYGDRLAARCTMNNDQDHYVKIGATNKDEMCNFYLMYYVENDEPLDLKYCFTAGPPSYYWNTSNNPLNNIPDIQASSL